MRNAKTITIIMVLIGSYVFGNNNRDSVMIVKDNKEIKTATKEYIKDGRLFFGPDIFWADQSPHIKGIHIKGDSVYYGLKLGYDNFSPNKIYTGIDALYAFGRTDFDAKANKEKVYKHTVSTSFANLEGRLGYNFYSIPSFYFSPFVGLGGYHTRPYKHLRYTEDWLYTAVGAKMSYVFGPIFSAGLNLKGMKIIYIDQHFHKESTSGSHRNSANAVGYGIELPLRWRLDRDSKWDVQLEPYYLKLNTKNNSNIAGARLTFGVNL